MPAPPAGCATATTAPQAEPGRVSSHPAGLLRRRPEPTRQKTKGASRPGPHPYAASSRHQDASARARCPARSSASSRPASVSSAPRSVCARSAVLADSCCTRSSSASASSIRHSRRLTFRGTLPPLGKPITSRLPYAHPVQVKRLRRADAPTSGEAGSARPAPVVLDLRAFLGDLPGEEEVQRRTDRGHGRELTYLGEAGCDSRTQHIAGELEFESGRGRGSAPGSVGSC